MPNWVYSGIEVTQPLTKKQLKIVDKIEKAGSICQYYKPQPLNLSNICTGAITINGERCNKWRKKLQIDGTTRDVPVTPEELIILKERYGYTDWYEWSLNNWNTKWGDCSLEINNCSISCELRFESAWSPICDSILKLFAKDFPDFSFWYEEECEWGGDKEYVNGECVYENSYDEPEWRDEEEIKIKGLSVNASFLEEEHPSYEYGVGYYEDYCRDQFLGKTIEDAVNTLEIWLKK